jgi:hypothetical protein
MSSTAWVDATSSPAQIAPTWSPASQTDAMGNGTGRAVDENPLVAIGSALPLVAYGCILLLRTPMKRPANEVVARNALADLCWVRGRWLLEFLLDRSDGAGAGDYVEGWKVADRPARQRMERDLDQTSDVVSHLLVAPAIDRRLAETMPDDLVAGFRQFMAEAPDGSPVRELLSEAVEVAARLLAQPDAAYYP